MISRAATFLPDAHARAIVAHSLDSLHRACVVNLQLAASRPIDGFARAYDTLVLQLNAPPPLRFWQSTPTAPHLREALILLQALSCFRGYSFAENFAFWIQHLGLTVGAHVQPVDQRFPLIALDWNPQEAGEQIRFDKTRTRRMLEFFTIRDLRLSEAGQTLLALVDGYDCSPRRPLDCIVSFRFPQRVADTTALVDVIVSAANAHGASSQTDVRWVGVRIVHDDTGRTHPIAHLQEVGRLCTALPSTITVDVRPPLLENLRSIEDSRRVLESYIAPAIGAIGTSFLGHMVSLDLTERGERGRTVTHVDVAAVSMLLPFARSLQKLRLAVQSTSDLLWLAYAIFHPLTPTTSWRALHLDGWITEPTDKSELGAWELVHQLVASRTRLATLWSMTTSDTSMVAPQADASSALSNDDVYVRRKATVARDTDLWSLDKSTMLCRLEAGFVLELCDTITAIDALGGLAPHAMVAVVVPGFGFGWISADRLTAINDTRYATGTPRSCLTTLSLGKYVFPPQGLARVLTLFGATLRHLRVFNLPPWPTFTPSDVAHTCPHLESLEIPCFESHVWAEAPAVVFPKLRYLVVSSHKAAVEACFQLLLHGLPVIHTIRFVLHDHTVPADALFERQCLKLFQAARTLRVFVLVDQLFTGPVPWTLDPCCCPVLVKLAFLSALRSNRASSPLGRLGEDTVRHIFAFAGPSVTGCAEHTYSLWPHDWYCGTHSRNWYW